MSGGTASTGWRIGGVIPSLLLLAFLADAGARFLPIDPLSFRAWEALQRFRAPGSAFEENRRYSRERTYGDLAAMGNLPELRQYRPETFTTDSFGFRNHERAPGVPLETIVVGDSFAIGPGVSDDENLTSQLGRFLGASVYNAGGVDPDPDRIVALARKLNLRRGLVVDEYNEDVDMPAVPTARRRAYQRMLARLAPSLGGLVARARGLLSVSPLQIACERTLKRIEDDRILPNSYQGRVVEARLRNGDSMLFLAHFLAKAQRRREAPTAYWVWLQHELRRGGLELLVVLAPSKYTVYRPFLADETLAAVPGTDYLDRVERELWRAGVPVLNLKPALSAYAARLMPHGEYLYFLDDLHWNALGTEISALALRDGLAEMPLGPLASRASAAATAAPVDGKGQ